MVCEAHYAVTMYCRDFWETLSACGIGVVLFNARAQLNPLHQYNAQRMVDILMVLTILATYQHWVGVESIHHLPPAFPVVLNLGSIFALCPFAMYFDPSMLQSGTVRQALCSLYSSIKFDMKFIFAATVWVFSAWTYGAWITANLVPFFTVLNSNLDIKNIWMLLGLLLVMVSVISQETYVCSSSFAHVYNHISFCLGFQGIFVAIKQKIEKNSNCSSKDHNLRISSNYY